MMTILPTTNIEKRSFESLSEVTHESRNSTSEFINADSASKRRKKMDTESLDLLEFSNITSIGTESTSFSAKMILQLAKTAMSSLDETQSSSSDKLYKESPIDSLAYSISLPQTDPKALNSQNLSLIIAQLTTEIAKFDNKKTANLLQSILEIDWIYHSSNSDNFSKNYATFLTVLVSSLPSWWSNVATKIIKDFMKGDPKQLQSHHETLKKLISIAPTASRALPSLLKLNFPSKNGLREEIINYVKNLLHLTEYYHVLVNHVWSLVIENFIKLDVEFQNQIDEIDDDDLAEALGLDESDEEEDLEGNDGDSDEEEQSDDEFVDEDKDGNVIKTVKDLEVPNDDQHLKSESKNVTFTSKDESIHDNGIEDNDKVEDSDDEMLDSEAEYEVEIESLSDLSIKLDMFLLTLLDYLKPNLSVKSLENGNGIQIFNSLSKAFTSLILPTHGTKATQYIIFHAAQQQPELMDAFLVTLFEIVFSGDKKNITGLSAFQNSNNVGNLNNRITGIQYIASFVARAKNLSKQQLSSVVTFLIDYCTAYMEENIEECDSFEFFNPNKHTIFYSLVQALMYIVCFRKDELRVTDESKPLSETGWVANLDKFFTRAVVSKFNPLRWCNETVVLIFSRVAQSEGICYTWSVIERIKRERLGKTHETNGDDVPSSSSSIATANISVGSQSSMRATQEFLDLVAFFPFDPLLLKNSRKIVEENYVDWQNDDEDENDSEV
ncbi:hypothetical protein CANINC_000811 [Pichia inconspicua]|uniref:RNA polymerase I-specific transcription initiation factor RRN3 n=1 Tax=Pichia inconspicua TaxID=52247 RepID=A0A4T0X5Q6_9ASCO|nr:hypothetical protein CANINC_000811 [[Candida] inconspicua]